MTRARPRRAAPTKLRKETREWLRNHTIPNVREIAKDLENAGEDVSDLLDAIDRLETILRETPGPASRRPLSKAEP